MKRNVFLVLSVLLAAAGGVVARADWKDAVQSLADKAADSGSQPVPVAGTRGLEQSDTDVDTSLRDYPSIEALEQVRLKSEQIDRFAKEGGLR